jgi:hypothetical protein
MYLLACGCKISWFHMTCENQWLNSYEYPYSCPTCRRVVPMKTNYSFSYEAGNDQKMLWNILTMATVEGVSMGFTEISWILPAQTAVILATPFIIYSNRTFSYFLHCVLSKMIIQYLILLIVQIKLPYYSALVLAQNVGGLQIFLIFLTHYVNYRSGREGYAWIDPYMPYAISREVLHARLVTQPATNTLERDETRTRSRRRQIR